MLLLWAILPSSVSSWALELLLWEGEKQKGQTGIRFLSSPLCCVWGPLIRGTETDSCFSWEAWRIPVKVWWPGVVRTVRGTSWLWRQAKQLQGLGNNWWHKVSEVPFSQALEGVLPFALLRQLNRLEALGASGIICWLETAVKLPSASLWANVCQSRHERVWWTLIVKCRWTHCGHSSSGLETTLRGVNFYKPST